MSKEIEIEMIVHCPITGDIYPYEKCMNCPKYREEISVEKDDDIEHRNFGKEINIVTMWCDYE
jgi:hypothetical protein